MSSKDQYGHPRIPHRGHYDSKRCHERRTWVESFCNCDLSHVGEWWSTKDTSEGSSNKAVSTEILKGNIENPVGLAKIPIGIVGPLLVHGDHIQGYAMCPFATTEGAVVASATRGAALLTRAGGVTCKVIHKKIGRSVAIMCDSLNEGEKLRKWVEANIEVLQSKVLEYSQHTRLTDFTCYTMGALLQLVLFFDTADAAGQNMISNATWICCKWIKKISLPELGVTIKHFYLPSLADGEKSNSSVNLLTTRGINVVAEAWLPESVILSTFKTTADELYRTYRYLLYGSVRTSRIGYNMNASNALAAVFTATGQDIAALLESSSAYFLMEPASAKDIKKHCGCENEEGLYVSYELTSLLIGTVGGGTNLPTQKECLQLMGCYGRGGVYRLAEIIAGVCLGLDLSTAAAISNGTFVSSHEKLGKNKPNNGLMPAHLNDSFFKTVLGNRGDFLSKTQFKIDTQNSIISAITANEVVKLVGHFGYDISYKDNLGTIQSLKVVIKSKPTDTEITNMINRLVQGCGCALATSYEAKKGNMGFRHCSEREVNIAASLGANPVLKKIHPEVYHTVKDIEKDVYLIIMELLHIDRGCCLFNTVHDISIWTEGDIKVVLRDLAQLHASYLSNEFSHVLSSNWIEEMGGAKMAALADVWTGLLDHAVLEFPQFWPTEWASIVRRVIPKIQALWVPLDSFDKTLVHNDCNPRNMCLRLPDHTHTHVGAGGATVPYKDPRTLCLYDWELSRVDVPQHDIVEFLAYILTPEVSVAKRKECIEFYRLHLEYYSGRSFPAQRFMAVYNVACLDFAVNRLLMYTMVHVYKDYAFLPRVVTSHMQYVQHEVENGSITLPILDSKL